MCFPGPEAAKPCCWCRRPRPWARDRGAWLIEDARDESRVVNVEGPTEGIRGCAKHGVQVNHVVGPATDGIGEERALGRHGSIVGPAHNLPDVVDAVRVGVGMAAERRDARKVGV